jgi:SOS-response transcriptional repressor LexA
MVNTLRIAHRHNTQRITLAMKSMASRLKWARESAGFKTAADFARQFGLEVVAYRHHENGTRGLRPEVARRYARFLKIEPNWLLYGEGAPQKGVELSPSLRPITYAKKISWVEAGKFAEGVPILSSGEDVPVIYHRPTVFALEVRGTSMNRLAAPGDLIIVDYEDRDPIDSKLYVVRCGTEITFKRFRSTNGPVRLEPDSTDSHDTIYPSGEDFVVVGRVVYILKQP